MIVVGLITFSQKSYALLDKITPDSVNLIKTAKDSADTKSKICFQKSILRGSDLFAGSQCKKDAFAQLFLVMCQSDSDAMTSNCAKNAKSQTKSTSLDFLATAFGKSAGGIGTDANAIVCKSDLTKLPAELKAIANKSCGVPPIMPVDMSKKYYNILSLDGGGMRGIGTAAILATLEMQTGKKFMNCLI